MKLRKDDTMKLIKNMLLFVLSLVLCFALSACGSNNTVEHKSSAAEEEDRKETTSAEKTSEDTEETTRADEDGKNILVAYFSYTGTTEKAAQTIAEYTGGDLAKIERAEEYDDVYKEGEVEIKEGIRPQITVSVDHIEEYDTIFVGYPIWWDEAPAMIATFLGDNDFSGKTIVPFCTSASDDIENSIHIFSELCPDAVIKEGLTAVSYTHLDVYKRQVTFCPCKIACEPFNKNTVKNMIKKIADDQNKQQNASNDFYRRRKKEILFIHLFYTPLPIPFLYILAVQQSLSS